MQRGSNDKIKTTLSSIKTKGIELNSNEKEVIVKRKFKKYFFIFVPIILLLLVASFNSISSLIYNFIIGIIVWLVIRLFYKKYLNKKIYKVNCTIFDKSFSTDTEGNYWDVKIAKDEYEVDKWIRVPRKIFERKLDEPITLYISEDDKILGIE